MEKEGPKYSLAMIVRNCAEQLENCLASFAEFPDELVIVNTALTKDEPGYAETNAVALKYNAKVYDFPWVDDFSEARKFSMSKCSHPYVMWLDADDIVEGGELVDRNIRLAIKDGNDSIFMEYLYEFDKEGNCTTMLNRERIVDARIYEWRAPIHEVLCARLNTRDTKMPAEIGRVIHSRKIEDLESKRKALLRNMRVFREQFEKKGKPLDLRMLFYRANTKLGLGDIQGAVDDYELYLKRCEDEGNKNYGEMYVAAWSLCEALRQLKRPKKAIEAAGRAILLNPRGPTGYLHMAECLMSEGDLDGAALYATQAQERAGNLNEEMVSNPKAALGLPAFILARVLVQKKEYEAALKYLSLCQKQYGEEDEFQNIEAVCKHYLALEREVEAFKRVRDGLWREKKYKAVYNLCLNAPEYLQDTRAVAEYLPKKRPADKNSIAFICPDSGANLIWGPDSIGKGIGGSEEAVINAARQFALRGWHVEVYCNTGLRRAESPKLADGVEYWPVDCWTGKHDQPLDVAIWWRAPKAPSVVGTSARKNYLWLHDIFAGNTWKKDTINDYDGVILLSKYHRDLHWIVPEEKVIYSENGLDEALLVPLDELTNEPHRMIWGSDPSRGLQDFLPHWSRIRDNVPDATLDIFYGWSQHFEQALVYSKWHREVHAKVEAFKNQPGITWHGKVGQDVLAKAYAKAGVWPYMTTFPEIHCITALKAQAHGVVPVTVDDFALRETVQFGDKIPGSMNELANQSALVDRVIHQLKNPWSREARLEMARWARQKTWGSVVDGWLKHFSVAPRQAPQVFQTQA